MDKQELIKSILEWEPSRHRGILEGLDIATLKDVLAQVVTDWREAQATKLLDIQIEIEDKRDDFKRSQFEAARRQREYAAQANEGENKRVFQIAARQLGFSEAEANLSVLQAALGILTVYNIQQFLVANPTALAPAAPEQIEQWGKEAAAEAIKANNARLLRMSPLELRQAVKAESEQRSQAAHRTEVAQMVKTTEERDAAIGFNPIPAQNSEGVALDARFFINLAETNMALYRNYLKKHGSANITARLNGVR
jgi:hypothetical protein